MQCGLCSLPNQLFLFSFLYFRLIEQFVIFFSSFTFSHSAKEKWILFQNEWHFYLTFVLIATPFRLHSYISSIIQFSFIYYRFNLSLEECRHKTNESQKWKKSNNCKWLNNYTTYIWLWYAIVMAKRRRFSVWNYDKSD